MTGETTHGHGPTGDPATEMQADIEGILHRAVEVVVGKQLPERYGHSILDVGTGSGIWTTDLAEYPSSRAFKQVQSLTDQDSQLSMGQWLERADHRMLQRAMDAGDGGPGYAGTEGDLEKAGFVEVSQETVEFRLQDDQNTAGDWFKLGLLTLLKAEDLAPLPWLKHCRQEISARRPAFPSLPDPVDEFLAAVEKELAEADVCFRISGGISSDDYHDADIDHTSELASQITVHDDRTTKTIDALRRRTRYADLSDVEEGTLIVFDRYYRFRTATLAMRQSDSISHHTEDDSKNKIVLQDYSSTLRRLAHTYFSEPPGPQSRWIFSRN
ncbi:methyltransferase domain-containing protein [Colletotrichum abscissum]